jgi:hypothetical protein
VFSGGGSAVGLDLAKMHDWIVAEFARCRPVADSMAALIKQCEKAQPHPDWAKLQALPFADLSPLIDWLQVPFREEPPTVLLRGLWFGLFNPCPDGRTPVADIYVSGSERFERNHHDNSWAVGPDWWPEARYASSSLLAEIYRIAYRQGKRVAEQKGCLGNDAEYPLCLGYGAFAVREVLAKIERSLILGESDSLGIAVGFDSGDFILLGELTHDGLVAIDRNSKPPEPSIEPVLKRLRSSDSRKVFLAVFDLQRFGDRARQAVPDLLRFASTSDEFGLRQAAVNVLASIAPEDPRAKAAVFQALNDSNPFVRREALQALIKIKQLSALDLARIKEMEKDSDKDVARWSEIALRNIRLRSEAVEPDDAPDCGIK